MSKYNSITTDKTNNKINKTDAVSEGLDDLVDDADDADESLDKVLEESAMTIWEAMVEYRKTVCQGWEKAKNESSMTQFKEDFEALALPGAEDLDAVIQLHKLVAIEFAEELRPVSRAALARFPSSNLRLALAALHARRKLQSGSWTCPRSRLIDIIFCRETLYLVVEGDATRYDLKSMTTKKLKALLQISKLAPPSWDAISHVEGSAA